MKKIVFALATFVTLNIGIGFAAPINDLAQDQTALGIGTDTFYAEHKFGDSFTLGFQNMNWGIGTMNDIYGQIAISPNLRGIVGTRNFASESVLYLGMAVDGHIASNTDGYASLIGGDQFKEIQVGANFRLTQNVDLNLNYHSYMPDFANNQTGVGVGATFKF